MLTKFYEYILFERGLSKNTLAAYKRDCSDYFEHFNSFIVPEDDVKRYFQKIKKNNSNATYMRKVSAIKSLYKFLVLNRYVEHSPMEFFKNIKKEVKIPNYLTMQDIQKLAASFDKDYVGERDKAIFDILVYTGARISEVLNLKLSDVDYDIKVIKFLGKGDKIRVIPAVDFLLDKIKRYVSNFRNLFTKKHTTMLFPNFSRNSFWYHLNKYAKKVDLKVYPHILRHSLATIMINNGANLRYVQEMLGHSNISTTEIYTHVSKDSLKKIYDNISHRKG